MRYERKSKLTNIKKNFGDILLSLFKIVLACVPIAVVLLIWAAIAAFWCLVIYALYLLVTGQLHVG